MLSYAANPQVCPSRSHSTTLIHDSIQPLPESTYGTPMIHTQTINIQLVLTSSYPIQLFGFAKLSLDSFRFRACVRLTRSLKIDEFARTLWTESERCNRRDHTRTVTLIELWKNREAAADDSAGHLSITRNQWFVRHVYIEGQGKSSVAYAQRPTLATWNVKSGLWRKTTLASKRMMLATHPLQLISDASL